MNCPESRWTDFIRIMTLRIFHFHRWQLWGTRWREPRLHLARLLCRTLQPIKQTWRKSIFVFWHSQMTVSIGDFLQDRICKISPRSLEGRARQRPDQLCAWRWGQGGWSGHGRTEPVLAQCGPQRHACRRLVPWAELLNATNENTAEESVTGFISNRTIWGTKTSKSSS